MAGPVTVKDRCKAGYCTAIVTVLLGTPSMRISTSCVPDGTLSGTWTFTWYSPTNPGTRDCGGAQPGGAGREDLADAGQADLREAWLAAVRGVGAVMARIQTTEGSQGAGLGELRDLGNPRQPVATTDRLGGAGPRRGGTASACPTGIDDGNQNDRRGASQSAVEGRARESSTFREDLERTPTLQ